MLLGITRKGGFQPQGAHHPQGRHGRCSWDPQAVFTVTSGHFPLASTEDAGVDETHPRANLGGEGDTWSLGRVKVTCGKACLSGCGTGVHPRPADLRDAMQAWHWGQPGPYLLPDAPKPCAQYLTSPRLTHQAVSRPRGQGVEGHQIKGLRFRQEEKKMFTTTPSVVSLLFILGGLGQCLSSD